MARRIVLATITVGIESMRFVPDAPLATAVVSRNRRSGTAVHIECAAANQTQSTTMQDVSYWLGMPIQTDPNTNVFDWMQSSFEAVPHNQPIIRPTIDHVLRYMACLHQQT
jgi:hypothetical protein